MPTGRQNTGRPQLTWKANILFKSKEQSKHGLIYDNEEEE
jgi:hypothetical protein